MYEAGVEAEVKHGGLHEAQESSAALLINTDNAAASFAHQHVFFGDVDAEALTQVVLHCRSFQR